MLVTCFVSCKFRKPGIPDMRDSFRFDDNRPMGASLATNILQDAYPDNWVTKIKTGFTDINYNYEDTASLYFMTGKNFFLSEQEAENLLNFVERGNTVFLSAQQIDTTLLELINCSQFKMSEQAEVAPYAYLNTQTKLQSTFGRDSSYKYFYFPIVNFFTADSASNVKSLGFNAYHSPNFIVFFKGKGALFLHCEPRVLSNYFLLQNKNVDYLRDILRAFPAKVEHLYVDDFYSKINFRKNERNGSLLAFIYSHPPLAWAFTILIVLFLSYLFINGKRRQRIVPIIKPVENASVSFAEVIAGLYRKTKENKNIAEKMITYFYEEVRSKYFINTSKVTEDFIMILSRKAGVEYEITNSLFYTIQMVQDSPEVSDELLMQLNEKIQQFKQT